MSTKMGRPPRRLGPGDEELLIELRKARDEIAEARGALAAANRHRDEIVSRAHDHGITWREIGAELGVKPQQALKEYNRSIDRLWGRAG